MLGFETFEAFYKSDLQGLYLLWIAPLVFLVAVLLRPPPSADRAIVPAAAPFLRFYALVFGIETLLDPYATGPLLRTLGIADAPAGTAVLIVFVLLGDFRVFLWVLRLVRGNVPLPTLLGEAAGWTLIVPVVAVTIHAAINAAFGPLPGQAIWLVYELTFVALALYLRLWWLRGRVPPSPLRAYVQDVLEYTLAYYLLWAAADAIILIAGSDWGWSLRVIPNQLYYSFYLPFVYFHFFTARRIGG